MESWKSWAILFSVTISKFVGWGLVFGGSGIIIKELNVKFDVDNSISSWLGSAAMGIILIGCPVASFIVHHIGARRTNVVAIILATGGLTLAAFATQIWQTILGYSFIASFGYSAAYMSGLSMIPLYFDKHRHFALAAQNVGSAGGAFAFPYAVRALFQALPYTYSLVSLAAVFTVYGMGVLLYDGCDSIEPQNGDQKKAFKMLLKESLQQYWFALSNPVLLVVFIATTLWSSGGNANLALAYSYMISSGHDESKAALAMLIMGMAQTVIMIILALINAKFEIHKYGVHIVSALLMAIALLCVPFISDTLLLIVVYGIFSCGYGLIIANQPSVIIHLQGTNALHIVLSILFCFSGLGAAVGVPTVVACQKRFGLHTGYHLISASLFSSVFLLTLMPLCKHSIWKHYVEVSKLPSKTIEKLELESERMLNEEPA